MYIYIYLGQYKCKIFVIDGPAIRVYTFFIFINYLLILYFNYNKFVGLWQFDWLTLDHVVQRLDLIRKCFSFLFALQLLCCISVVGAFW